MGGAVQASSSVRLERDFDVARLTLDRPPVNAIDLALLLEAERLLQEIEQAPDVRALVVTGAGRCFSAGLDLRVVPTYSAERQRDMIRALNAMVLRLYRLPMPTVAAVNGHAIAGGLVIALACDHRVGTTGPCRIGLTEARAGVPFPAAPRAVVQAELAPAVVRRLVLGARNLDAKEALAADVLDELCDPERVGERAREVARDLAEAPISVYGRVKQQFRAKTIEELERIAATDGDPVLASWITPDGAVASKDLLAASPAGRRR
ncbi:MAG: enoyl-CoA hydratase/isomerase family protein [Deltaproteobacteria bacterium]|nr:enoyl-CoA hydratase/isomerase family protein [Deltaproteobacteria bacterium]